RQPHGVASLRRWHRDRLAPRPGRGERLRLYRSARGEDPDCQVRLRRTVRWRRLRYVAVDQCQDRSAQLVYRRVVSEGREPGRDLDNGLIEGARRMETWGIARRCI